MSGIWPPTAPAGTSEADRAATIADTLAQFGIRVRVSGWDVGPVVTRYELEPAPGVKIGRIRGYVDDLALALAAAPLRIEAPIPGRHSVGIEVPNAVPGTVALDDCPVPADAPPLTVALGADVTGAPFYADLARLPHLLIAGATGSGKSVQINAIITGLIRRTGPADLALVLIDLKRVELAAYHGIPHLLSDIITEPKPALRALTWAVGEMERRYTLLAGVHVRGIADYNADPGRHLPYIVIVVDELADLMVRGKAVEAPIVRLAQKARATGIHLILATQRPSVNVITGLIKANFPARMAFAMAANVDSRTILDSSGAENLIGRGDMLYQPPTQPHPVRLQGVYVSDDEIDAVADAWRAVARPAPPTEPAPSITGPIPPAERAAAVGDVEDDDEPEEAPYPEPPPDERLPEAAAIVLEYRTASIALLERRMRIPRLRAAVIVNALVRAGALLPAEDGGYAVVKPPSRHWWSR